MQFIAEIASVTEALARIFEAGDMRDLQVAIAEALRGWPARDLDRWPHHRPAVEALARLTSQLTGWPLSASRDASCEVLLPTTRRRIVLALIAEHAARLNGNAGAAAKLARERARRPA